MNTKRTILSEKELNIIEDLIAKYSIIVNFEQLYELLKNKMSRQAVRNLANKLTKNGWLVRIKKGIYAIANIESRGTVSIHSFKIAQVLVKDSYISFESALQHHGMFDQILKTVSSVSVKRHKTIKIDNSNYEYIYTKKDLFFGWEEKRIENYLIKVATIEKAILDMLYFRRNIYSVDLIFEKIKEYNVDINLDKLNQFSKKYSITVQRILGFLLDRLSIESKFLYELVKENKGCSFMNKDSNEFDSKWRLYYHEHFKNIL